MKIPTLSFIFTYIQRLVALLKPRDRTFHFRCCTFVVVTILKNMTYCDITIIGTRVGGENLAHAIPATGKWILMIDRCHCIPNEPDNENTRLLY